MNRTIRVSAAGDILIMKRLLPGYQDVLPIREFLMQGEVRMANLETTISDGSCYASAYSGGTWLTADAKCLEDTLRYGFNFLGISNNHTMDYSYEGLASTISELKKKDVAYAGAGKNLYEASRPAILDTTAGQIAVIDICSTLGKRSYKSLLPVQIPQSVDSGHLFNLCKILRMFFRNGIFFRKTQRI